jgi:hypothetical protein
MLIHGHGPGAPSRRAQKPTALSARLKQVGGDARRDQDGHERLTGDETGGEGEAVAFSSPSASSAAFVERRTDGAAPAGADSESSSG